MDVFQKLPEAVDELVRSFDSTPAVGSLQFDVTQYSFWMVASVVLLLLVMFIFKKRQAASLVPKGKFVNGMEYLIEFVRDDLCIIFPIWPACSSLCWSMTS